MTQLALLSRLVEWFADQPEMVRAAILGHVPAGVGEDAGRQVIKAMADKAGSAAV